jgi:hypothetical protein
MIIVNGSWFVLQRFVVHSFLHGVVKLWLPKRYKATPALVNAGVQFQPVKLLQWSNIRGLTSIYCATPRYDPAKHGKKVGFLVTTITCLPSTHRITVLWRQNARGRLPDSE